MYCKAGTLSLLRYCDSQRRCRHDIATRMFEFANSSLNDNNLKNMKENQVVKHANAVNLARRLTAENEHDFVQVSTSCISFLCRLDS